MTRPPRLYTDLARWWPLMSRPEDYADEAGLYASVLSQMGGREVREVLELGCGGGNNAWHLKAHFDMTLVDVSEQMLEVSRGLNPECRHVLGDMRDVRLGADFDAVFVHDAVMYMTSEEDLRAAVTTAAHHVRPGGVVLFVPDETVENFEARTTHGGHDGEDRSMRYLEWTHERDPDACSYVVSFVFALREGRGPVEVVYDDHTFGVFPRATWLGLLERAGLQAGALKHSYGEPAGFGESFDGHRELFVGIRPSP